MDLILDSSRDFVIEEIGELEITNGDLSQLGLVRNSLRKELQIPIHNAFRMDVNYPSSSKFMSSIFKKLDNDVTVIPPSAIVRLVIDTTPLANLKLSPDDAASKKMVSELQTSLDPKKLAPHEAIIESLRLIDAIRSIKKRAVVASSAFAGFISSQLTTNNKLGEFLVNAGIIAEDTHTVTEERVITGEQIKDMGYQSLLMVSSLVGDMPSEFKKHFEVLEFIGLHDALGDDESVYEHPLIRDIYATAKNEAMSKGFDAPAWLSDIFSKASNGSNVHVQASALWREGENEKTCKLEIKVGKNDIVGELAFYLLSLKQVQTSNIERARDFAFMRLLVLRHALSLTSDELCPMTCNSVLTVDPAEINEWFSKVRQPEKYYSFLYVSMISFLKSGHHASAANLDNTLVKVMSAMGSPISLEVARNWIPCAVYFGPHVASVRMLYAYLLFRSKSTPVSNAIALRMAPNPPLASGYCNLEIFIDALHSAGFFDALGTADEYRHFKDNMKEIRSSMHYVAPYAFYLYGKSAPDPLFIKQEAGKLAAYASALKDALPGTSLIMSPALMKLAGESSRNSISATLHVQGFASAFQRFFRITVEQSLAKRLGVTRRELIAN